MTAKQPHPSPDIATDDPLVKALAETTDLSPNQAVELIGRHGRDLDRLRRIAATMKAES